MLSTTVTPRAITSANPRSSPKSCRSLFISDPRAVPQVDRVGELVLADRAAFQADRKVELEGRETAAAGRVREGREDVGRRQVVRELDPARAARRAGLPVERVAVREAADGDRAPADVAAAPTGKLQRHGVGGEGRDIV